MRIVRNSGNSLTLPSNQDGVEQEEPLDLSRKKVHLEEDEKKKFQFQFPRFDRSVFIWNFAWKWGFFHVAMGMFKCC